MKKRGKIIKHRSVASPTMVAMCVKPEVGLIQHTALMAFAGGWASNQHFSTLVDVADHLLLGSNDKDEGAQNLAHAGRLALMNISERYQKTKKIGASGDELRMLRAMVEVSEDFWSRQSGAHYLRSSRSMDVFRKIQEDKKASEASNG